MTPQQLSDYAYDCDYLAPDSPEPDYRYVVKLVLRSTLYFRDGHTPETRHALRSCFDDFFAAFGKELRWGWDPQPAGGKPTPWRFDERLADATRTACGGVKADDNLELGFSSSLSQHYAGDHGIECFTRPDWEQAIGRDNSYLTFWIPFDTEKDGHWGSGPFAIHDFLVSCCNRLKVQQGYAGFALALPYEYDRWQPYELELAQKYYGLEIDNPISTLGMVNNWKGIKDVNWYTILGEHYVNKLGGSRRVQASLTDSAFHLYDLAGGGLIIRAGEEPEMAPVDRGLPPRYVAVNNVVRSVRTTEIRSLGQGSNAGEHRFNLRLTDLWMRRFDAPGIWPPAYP